MIICHPLKLIFVKTKKVGGTSFEIALAKYCSSDCIITEISPADEKLRVQLGFRPAQNFDFTNPLKRLNPWRRNPGYRGKFWNHIESEEIRERIPAQTWDEYTKVAIHRNPFDVLVSKYFWSQRNVEVEKKKPFDDWYLRFPQKASMNLGIAPISGDYAMDKVVRYDALEQDIEALGIDGLWNQFSSIRAKGNIRPKDRVSISEMYRGRKAVVESICELCAEEIEYFGYQIPTP